MFTLDHIAVRVANLDRAIAFYVETMGFELQFRKSDPEHHEAFAFLRFAGGALELLQKLDENNRPLPYSGSPPAEPFCPHMAFVAEDLDHLIERFRQVGVPLVKGPLEITDTVRWLYVHDPDNNVIEFVQWLQPEPEPGPSE